MQLRDWPEFDLIGPAGANRLIVGFKTVGTIVNETNLINKYGQELPRRHSEGESLQVGSECGV